MSRRGQKSSFTYTRPGKDVMKPKDPRQNPIQISKPDYENLDTSLIHRVITNSCLCPHKMNPTQLFMFEYRDGGISIDFAKEGCKGQAVIYLDLNGKPKSIDCIVECEDV